VRAEDEPPGAHSAAALVASGPLEPKAKAGLVIGERGGGYDISPPKGFTLHLHHPTTASP
jgi:hypothetical protein